MADVLGISYIALKGLTSIISMIGMYRNYIKLNLTGVVLWGFFLIWSKL